MSADDDESGRAVLPKTIDEIASATGFSRTTVRFVITGQAARYRIKDDTRDKIEAYVRENGIVINHTARSLRLKRSDAIGLVLPDLDNLFFAALTSELEELCRSHGKVLLTALSHDDTALEARAIGRLLERGIDGLVVTPCAADTVRSFGSGQRCAVVLVDRAFSGVAYPTVISDNREAAYALTGQLLREGSPDIELLCAMPRLPSVADRIVGFTAACHDFGLDDVTRRLHATEIDDITSGAALMARVIAIRGDHPSVFLTSSLPILEGALRHLMHSFGGLPPALLLGTFDYHPLLDFFSSRILSIQQDEKAIAERVFDMLAAQMAGGPTTAERIVVPSILRQSSRLAGTAVR